MELAQVLFSGCGRRSNFFDLNSTFLPLKPSSRPSCLFAISPLSSNLWKGSSSSSDSLSIQLGSSLDAFKLVQADVVKVHMLSKRKRRLKYYTKLAGRLAEDGHLLEMADLVAMLADAGLDRFNFINSISLDHVHSACTSALSEGQLDLFMAFVKKLHAAGFCASRFVGDGAMALLSEECNSLLMRGQLDRCISVLETLSGSGFLLRKVVDTKQVILCCARSRNVDAAIKYASMLPPINLHYNHMIQEFGNQGNLQAAFTIFSSMEEANIKPDMYTYRTLIDACAHQGDASKATAVFKEIIQSGNQPNVYVYNSLMNVHAGDAEVVWQLYEDMRRVGVEPDLATYNIMLKSCSVSKCAERAKALYSDMEAGAATTGLKLDVFTYTTAIHIFGEAKMWDLALKVKEDMIDAGVTPNVITWTALLGACANVGMVEQAFNIFSEMLVAGCPPNSQTYNMLINACCEANQHDRAFLLFKEWKNTGKILSCREIEDSEFSPVQIGEFLLEESISGSCEDDVKSSTRSYHSKPNLVTYNTLMKACGQEPKLVKEVMDNIISAGLTPDRTSWSTLIDAYGSKGYLEEAINVFRSMKDVGITPDLVAYTSIIKACVEARDSDMAFQFFRELKGVGLRPNKVTYNTLFRAQRTCRKLCEVQRALALYEEMRDAGFAPNDGILRVLLEQWAEGAIEDGVSEQRASSVKYQREASAGFSEYTQLLLQKVAVHAQAKNPEPKLIDLHGLSRGESRIAVLAVLRIIKERYSQGHPIKDGLVIITGIGRHSESPGNSVIRHAVLHVLQDELGLPVTCGPTEIRIVRKTVQTSSATESTSYDRNGLASKVSLEEKHRVFESQSTSGEDDQSDSLDDEEMSDGFTGKGDRGPSFIARKPTNFGRLIVTRDALEAWLTKKRTRELVRRPIEASEEGKTVS
ncbi:protein MpPPR_69 [Marchantia polymorpha subsp. ruderalis]|uniref:Smr domain-containing protein n=2 Tax=Marchantia polymorpha TaxID=3197 RepID=A0AAF6B1N0_MARPO|nr:hypothetical protein MARPO_0039s0098 [Marchantia polymorpha]BBN05914.1 hypothetical protein Mp_3g16970 [Marchantia polymorpha subsp. ruderalis]|eukprot:PTQ40611.1 hypothetical protein MARPO_0039s0098 [Marchantia polymorpha]